MEAYNQITRAIAKVGQGLDESVPSFKRFAQALALREARPRTIEKHLRLIRILAKHFDKTDIASLNSAQLETFVLWLLNSEYTKGTREEIKMSVRLFYRLMGQEKKAAWIKARKLKSTLEAASIIVESEVYSMIQASESLRDQALIAVLYDTGVRPEELLGLRFKDVDLSGYPCHITVQGKTGKRRIPLTFSATYLAKYMDATPRLIDGTLWIREDRGAKPGALGNAGLGKMLRVAAMKVGIEKRVYAYLFRHSAYTRDSKKYKEAILKRKYGWCKGSEMPEVYEHLDDSVLDSVVANENTRPPTTLELQLERIEKNQHWIMSRLKA